MNDKYEDKKSSSISIEIPDNVHIAITAVTGIAAAITGPFYPLTSAIIASSLAIFPVLFKPENKVDIFDTIYHRISSLIDNKIDQVIYDNSKQHLEGISRLFEDFSLKLKEWEKDKTKGTEDIRMNIYYLDNQLTSTIPMFQHPKQQGALLPLFANAAYRHITLLYTAITYYDELKFDRKIKLNSRASKDYFTTKIIKLIKEYSDYSGIVYKKEFKRIINNEEKSWIDLNEYRNICTSSVHSYIMMLDFFNPETYPLAILTDRRGYYRVIQSVVKDKDLDFPILSKTKNFDDTFSNHYAVGKLEKIELGSLENLPYSPYTVSGLVYSYCYLYQFNNIKKNIGNKLNTISIVSEEADISNVNVTGVRGLYPLPIQNGALIKPASCLKELFFNLNNKPISDSSQIEFLFIKKDVDNKIK
ncbi:insecticidal delta-endotoxin Cry8Ea1 family protein [Xenorhabdus sp. XENO-1]|uniref:insecticidal delta-endotoxin Cry8Ea1 family protein n=1 Tax=Xenorhabdus bovienii TaxID=40576 RepID=UPI0020CA8C48|nr:insecticidal delta-endotoxin Cry8Ea1 family protein [Xenorhabdus bovienii]MCP9269053.1 insecticidal delta-endotoxin Cry8Ea1 family protein [Xenorhabdus bovienii subsp. africana]